MRSVQSRQPLSCARWAVLGAALLLVVVAVTTCAATSAWAAEAPYFTVHQTVQEQQSSSDQIVGAGGTAVVVLAPGDFSCDYRLVADDAAAPMPQGSEGGVYRWTMHGSDDTQRIEFPASSLTGTGTYTYTMQQVAGDAAGYDYDPTTYRVTLESCPDGAWVVLVRNAQGEKVPDPGWTVTHRQASPAGNGGQEQPSQTTPDTAVSSPVQAAQSAVGGLAKTGDALRAAVVVATVVAVALVALLVARRSRRQAASQGTAPSSDALEDREGGRR